MSQGNTDRDEPNGNIDPIVRDALDAISGSVRFNPTLTFPSPQLVQTVAKLTFEAANERNAIAVLLERRSEPDTYYKVLGLLKERDQLLAACKEAEDLLSCAGYSTIELRDAIANCGEQ